MSLESLLLNALKCHLVFAGSLQLTEGWGDMVGSWVGDAEGDVLEWGASSIGPHLLMGGYCCLKILLTDEKTARAQK